LATKVYLIPGVGFVQVPDSGSREYLIPGGGFFSEGAGSPDVEVSATKASLTLTTYAATVAYDVGISASCSSLTLTTLDADVDLDVSISATCSSLTLTTNAAVVNAEINVGADVSNLTLTTYGATVTVVTDVSVIATCAELTLSTAAANINAEVSLVAECASFTLTTYQASVNLNVSISASASSLTLATYGATIKADIDVSASCASLVLSAKNATVGTNISVDVSATCASFSLATHAATIASDREVTTAPCQLTLAMHKANVNASTVVAASCDALILADYDATIKHDREVSAALSTLILRGLSATISENVRVISTCANFKLVTRHTDITWDSKAVTEVGWTKDKNLGPWEFVKPSKKYGYINNPRWVAKKDATDKHKPCGYWPLVYSKMGYYQQSVDMYDDTKIVGAGMIAQDHSHYKLIFLNYETDELIKQFDIYPSNSTNTFYGSITITKKPDGEMRIVYVNYDGLDLCAYVWDYNSSPHKIVLHSDSSGYLTSIVNAGNGILMARDSMADYIYTSTDYGDTWTRYATPDLSGSSWSGMPAHLLYDRNGRIYLIGTLWSFELGYDDLPFRAYYSDNYGETWTYIDHGLDDTYGDGHDGVYPCVDGDVIYIVKYSGSYENSLAYIFISLNRGVSWSVVAPPTVEGVGFIGGISVGVKDGVLILEGQLNDEVNWYPPAQLRSVDYGENWTAYSLPPYSVFTGIEKTAYWQFGITDNFWIRTVCGLYISPGDLSFMVSVNDSLNWMNRSLHVGALSVDYGPNPVWTIPVGNTK